MRDLTKGSITKNLIFFAFPVLIGNIFQQFYALIDTKIVGETLGTDAFSALGAVGPVYSLIIGFAVGMSNGFGIIIAKNYGANDYIKMRRSVGGTLVLGIGLTALLTAASLLSIRWLLNLLGTPDILMKPAMDYITVIFAGMIFTMLYNILSGILRALGDTKMPLVFLAVASVINIILDYLFIKLFSAGIAGAAYATLISQLISVLMCYIYIRKRCPELHLKAEDFKITPGEYGELLSSGIAMGFMISFVDIGSVVLQSAVNSLGPDIIASHTAARKVSGILMMPYGSIISAIATFCGQNLGAGQISRIKKGIFRSIEICFIWSAFVLIFGYTALSPITVSWLASTSDVQIVKTAVFYLKINTPFYFVLTILLILRSAMQGFGKRITPVVSSIIELFGKIGVSLVLSPWLGYFGVCISEPIIWILCSIWLVISILTDKTLKICGCKTE